MEHVLDVLRIANAAVSAAVLVIMIIRFPQWRDLSPGDFRFRVGSLFLLGATCYASVEGAVLGTQQGPRTIILTVAMLILAYAALSFDSTRDRK